MIKVLIGDIFESNAQTLVNTVNTVGVMGKGVALGFRKHFPEMYDDYVRRCERHEVQLGKPYLFRRVVPPHIINFPTKEHWRSVSRLEDIVKGLRYLQEHVQSWGVTSLAVPPLGCGEGQLEWRVVGPTLYRGLYELGIPVELYAPFGTPYKELEPDFLDAPELKAERTGHYTHASTRPFRVDPGWVALVAILEQVQKEPYHWPIGRVGFQKLAYFATEVGIPTGLSYHRGSYGPYAEMKQILTPLINNGLIVERKLGRMFSTEVGKTFEDAKTGYKSFLMPWKPMIDAVADLVVRMDTDDAEIAATVHFAANRINEGSHEPPTESEILNYVMDWKIRRRPPLDESEVALAIRRLNVLGWIKATASEDLPIAEEAMIA